MHEPPIRAPEWGDEAIWENGLKSLNEDKVPKERSKVEKSVELEQVDWSMAWKTNKAVEQPSPAIKEEPQAKSQKAAKGKGKKDASRPSPAVSFLQPTSDASDKDSD